MEALVCPSCGSNRLEVEGAFLVCPYCGTRAALGSSAAVGGPAGSGSAAAPASEIALDEDVKRLLEKCHKFPSRAPKIARTILEIDPYNEEAKRYL